MIDYYERRAHNPSVEFVRQAARILGVPVVELLGEDVQTKRARKTGPSGKVHRVFEEVSKLPAANRKRSLRSSRPSSVSTRKVCIESLSASKCPPFFFLYFVVSIPSCDSGTGRSRTR
jgi:hypothetical protein